MSRLRSIILSLNWICSQRRAVCVHLVACLGSVAYGIFSCWQRIGGCLLLFHAFTQDNLLAKKVNLLHQHSAPCTELFSFCGFLSYSFFKCCNIVFSSSQRYSKHWSCIACLHSSLPPFWPAVRRSPCSFDLLPPQVVQYTLHLFSFHVIYGKKAHTPTTRTMCFG